MDETNEAAIPAEADAAAQREEALAAREEALSRRERAEKGRAGLRERGLPERLAECLDLSSDERAEETLNTLASAFTEALNSRVVERLGAEPPRRAGAIAGDPMAAIRKAMGLN